MNEELYHYGVIGMKWGVKRGKTAEAYEKASAKLKKLDTKVEKAKDRSRRATEKADRRTFGLATSGMRARAQSRANKASYKAAKATRKAYRFYTSMEKTFKNTDIGGLSKEQISMGEKYLKHLNRRAESRY